MIVVCSHLPSFVVSFISCIPFQDGQYGMDVQNCSKLSEAAQELMSYYVCLEQYYMIENVNKAISIDDCSTEEGVPGVSSMVDDVFFILKKCTERAFSTSNVNGACAIINHLNSVLQSKYKDSLVTKMNDAYKKYNSFKGVNVNQFSQSLYGSSAASAAVPAIPEELLTVLVAINSIFTSSLHMQTLTNMLQEEFDNMQTKASVALVGHCLEDLNSTVTGFHVAVTRGVNLLLDAFKAKLEPAVVWFLNASYDFKQSDYNAEEINARFPHNFIAVLMDTLNPYTSKLLPVPFDELLMTVVDFTAQMIERAVMKKKFSFWGGLQFDKDIRAFNTAVATFSSSSLRDKFARLIQIASGLHCLLTFFL